MAAIQTTLKLHDGSRHKCFLGTLTLTHKEKGSELLGSGM